MKTSILFLLASTAILSGCKTTAQERDPVAQKMMKCGAGIDNKFDASLSAQIAQDLRTESKISAGLEHQLRAAYFAGADPKDPNVEKGFEKYLDCMDKPL